MRTIAVAAVVVAAATAIAAREQSRPRISVGSNVQVSKANADRAHYEINAAADPDNPGRLLLGSMVTSTRENAKTVIAYRSGDSGRTWETAIEDRRSDWVGDPAVTFGLDGAAYLSTLALFYFPEQRAEMLVHHSADGGKTWKTPTILPFIDREYLVVDRTQGKHRGRLYLNGTGNTPLVDPASPGGRASNLTLLHSDDRGSTFSPPFEMAAVDRRRAMAPMGNSVVLSDGTLVVLAGETETGADRFAIHVAISTDGGASVARTVTVANVVRCGQRTQSRGTSRIPYLAVDSSGGPFQDRLYAVWPDGVGGRCDIRLAWSADKGRTWSAAVVVNDDLPPATRDNGPDHLMPVVAVNRAGVVGVSWYDRRESTDNLGWYCRFSASIDGGESFWPSVRVAQAPYAHPPDEQYYVFAYSEGGGTASVSRRGPVLKNRIGPDFYYLWNAGDTGAIAADAAGVFHPFWIDNRTGTPQVWTAAVTVDGQAVRNGATELAELDDLTQRVTLRFSNTTHDPVKHTIALDAMIGNTSDLTLVAPLKLRVTGLRSPAGVLKVVNADGGGDSVGAIWDFSSLVEPSGLSPRAVSGRKRLTFRIQGFDPKWIGYSRETFLVNLEAKLYGRAK